MKLEQQLSLEQKVDDVLNELKPMLATHGGDVRLVNITKDKVAEVEFIGSCVGCSIVDVTLNNGLKEAILLSIPEISDVRDITKHHE